MKKYLFVLWALTAPVMAQGEDIDADSPIYWDANTESDMDTYGVYRSDTPCTDPTPATLTCPTFSEVAAVAQGADPIQWTEPGPVVFLQDYYYRITARNTSGAESGMSNELNLRWLNPTAPGVPGDPRTSSTVAIIIEAEGVELAEVIVRFVDDGIEPVLLRTTRERR